MLLSLLNRRFKARLLPRDVERQVSDADARSALYDKRVLVATGCPDTAQCGLGVHDGDGIFPIEQQPDGNYSGFCPEHGQHVVVAKADAELLEFNPEAWAAAVQSANGLTGEYSIDAAGYAFLGILSTKSKKAGLVLVSPQAVDGGRASYRPPSVGGADLIFIDLGDASASEGLASVKAADLFEPNLVKIRRNALDSALAAIGPKYPSGTQFVKYSSGQRQPLPLTAEQYEEELSATRLKKPDLVIDIPRGRAWLKGKVVQHMKNKGDGGRKKKLSPTGLKLMGYYLRHSGRPIKPGDVPPYSGKDVDSRDPLTPMVMMANMRNTLGLHEVIQTSGNPHGNAGGSLYTFSPPAGFEFVLITTPEEV
jgi:hypothetical protein